MNEGDNEAFNATKICCASVRFHSNGGETLLAVGTATDLYMYPLRQSASHIVSHRIVNGKQIRLLHRTSVEDGPGLAPARFQGRLLVGIGKSLLLGT